MHGFQFHKGSIQTYVPIRLPFSCCHFNSIKVQFKLRAHPLAVLMLSFQFHKGSIQTIRAHLHAVPLLQFQFHKGSIQTCPRCSAAVLLRDFNSIKVQFKPIENKNSTSLYTMGFVCTKLRI